MVRILSLTWFFMQCLCYLWYVLNNIRNREDTYTSQNSPMFLHSYAMQILNDLNLQIYLLLECRCSLPSMYAGSDTTLPLCGENEGRDLRQRNSSEPHWGLQSKGHKNVHIIIPDKLLHNDYKTHLQNKLKIITAQHSKQCRKLAVLHTLHRQRSKTAIGISNEYIRDKHETIASIILYRYDTHICITQIHKYMWLGCTHYIK